MRNGAPEGAPCIVSVGPVAQRGRAFCLGPPEGGHYLACNFPPPPVFFR
jgi:hypothetical protein